ncbi:MAG TPA: anhydro-N-acetylmuramic acid kinase [Acidimicrobiales bacterium]|nr:anhydro-N-acetylmuramic acid kinase [Acidimicrobiales bacterium]
MRVIGMISGTSFDAVEALLADISQDGSTLRCELVEHRSVSYPRATREGIAAILPPASTTVEQVCRLDVAIGQFFGQVAGEMTDRHGPVDVVCSHGQTVYHWVDGATALGTLQLGEAAWIAHRTGAAVVSDVRNRDIANGGHGAPLASLLDVLLLGSRPQVACASLNLGGIANATVLQPGHEPVAFDIGPANALLDAAVCWVTDGQQSYDRGGALARRGQLVAGLVERLLDDPFYGLAPPKSTGKERFNLAYLKQRVGDEQLRPEDLLASVTAAAAESIARALRPFGLHDLVLAGGGTRNPRLMSELAVRLPGVPTRLIDELGVPEAAKEALLFAIIGFLTLHNLPATVPSCTGAARASVLGSVTPGRGPLLLRPAQGATVPTRLVIEPVPAR